MTIRNEISQMPYPDNSSNRRTKRIVHNPLWVEVTESQFDSFLEEHFSHIERTGSFLTVNAKTLFHCTQCGLGTDDDPWLKKPASFLVAVQYRKKNRGCPRCSGHIKSTSTKRKL